MKFKNQIKNLPQKPGVYLFKDQKDEIIYVGKAQNLKERVSSYFIKNQELSPAKQVMLKEIDEIEHIITDNEAEAILLEANLIKKYHPRFNIVLKDDKSFLYLKIDYEKVWPEIYLVRHPDFKSRNKSLFFYSRQGISSKKVRDKYFGPYPQAKSGRETLKLIKKIFPICLNLPQKKGVRKRACFNYHLGRCLGPCVGEVNLREYQKIFNNVQRFLRGRYKKVLKDLKSKMEKLSKEKKFEKAARVRDQIFSLEKVMVRQKIISSFRDDQDYISLYREEDLACINIFIVREGKLIDKKNFILEHISGITDKEVISEFIGQYYLQAFGLPKELIVKQDIERSEYWDIARRKLKIVKRVKGKKFKLLSLGEENAKEYLEKEKFSLEKKEIKTKKALAELKKILNLKSIPHRLEAFDISNIQGQKATGSMVVFEQGLAKKSDCRKFKIKIEGSPNDVAMMKEVLRRRFKHLLSFKEKKENWPLPDLIILDGGKPQLNVIVKELKSLKTKKQIPVIAIAKRLEEIFIPGHKNPLILPKNSPALHLLEQIRDEAHRFAISYYRKRHKKEVIRSILDEVPGIGPKLKRKLLEKFGSLKGISEASDEELSQILSKKKLKILREYL